MDLADYVLGHFPADELKTVRESLESAADAVESILADGVDIAMNKYNIKPSGPKEQKKKETEE